MRAGILAGVVWLAGAMSFVSGSHATARAGSGGVRLSQAGAQRGIRDGAVELLVGGDVTRVEGSSTARLQLGAARYAAGGSLRVGADVSYAHISSLDVLDLEARPGWVLPLGNQGMYVVLDAAAAYRQQWVGSFRNALYPVGFDAAFKSMAGRRAALTVRAAWRRVFGDPVADFNELRIVASLSVWFHNAP